MSKMIWSAENRDRFIRSREEFVEYGLVVPENQQRLFSTRPQYLLQNSHVSKYHAYLRLRVKERNILRFDILSNFLGRFSNYFRTLITANSIFSSWGAIFKR